MIGLLQELGIKKIKRGLDGEIRKEIGTNNDFKIKT